jgi:aspartate 1-decarboxylase
MTVTVNKGNPIINTWTSLWRSRTYGNPTFSLEVATANVAGTFTYTSGAPSVISLNGRVATIVGAGTSVITASFTPTDTDNYESTATASLTFTVMKNTPSLTWSNVSKNLGDTNFTLTPPTTSVPGTYTYTSATPSVISLNGDVATVAGMGTSVITANFTPVDTNNYGTTSKTITITVNATAQTITRTSTSPTSPVKSETYTPTATASSSLTVAISIASGSSSVCSISAGIVSFTAAGSCVIQYNQSGNASYAAATQVTETLTIGRETPTFTWSNASKTLGDSTFTVTAPTVTGSLAGSFTYSSATTSVISISGSTFTVVGAGTSVITATFTPTDSANYNTATTNMTITVGSASQAITRTSTSPSSPVKSGTYTPTATASSSLTVAISIAAGSSSVCSISAGIVTFNSVGSCVIQYNQSGNSNYLAATQVTETLSIGQEVPTFTWAGVSKVYGETFSLTAPTPSTPGTFTYSSATTSVVTISLGTATIVSNGTSVITATFTPNDTTNFVSGGTITMTISADRAAITVTPTAGQSKVYGENNPIITYSVTSGALVGSDVLSGALAYSGSNVGTYPISVGTLANSKYIITLTAVNFSITKATQGAVTLSSMSSAFSSSNKTVSLTGSGGTGTGYYQYSLDSSNTTAGCSVTGSTLSYVTAGTCVVAVKRTSDTNYLERTDAVSFSIGLASQAITFSSLSAKSYSSDTFTVSATSSASLTVVFTSGSPSICTTSGDSGSTITILNIGTCIINANQIGDSNIAAASQVSQNFTVNPRAITVTADAKSKVYGSSDPTFTYSITTGSLVLGDALTGALTRATGTDVGTYQIQQGALTTSNNPKYAITFVGADLSITRATPTLVLSYPNSNVAILRPGATDTPTVTTSSSSGALTFATSAASSICTVDSSSGVISLFGAGTCPIGMTSAITTNFISHTETTTVTVALLSTSLVGIDTNDLVSMGQPFYAHATIDQLYSFSSGSNGASISIPAGALNSTVPISISLLTDSADQRAMIGGTGTSVLSVVVSWVASDGSVPSTNAGKAISVTLTNAAIKAGAKIYSIIGNQSTLLGTATADGSVTSQITDDPVLLVINPVVTAPAPSVTSSSGAFDNSAAIAAANAKLQADKDAAELKAAQDKKAAEEAELAALKAAKEIADAEAQAAATLKAAQDKAAEELRIAEELRLANLKAEEDLKIAAAKKAVDDIAATARALKPAVTLYSVSPKLKLSAYDSAYLDTYVKSLKNGATVTCIGYSYSKKTTIKKATALAKSQASAVCTQMKKLNKTLKTSVVVYPSTKAPKAATGAKWVGVSYRIDGFKPAAIR